MKLLDNATKSGDALIFTGGLATVFCWGVFDNATVKLRVSPDSTQWFDLDGYTFNVPSNPKNLHMSECWIKGEIINPGVLTNINLMIKKFHR